TGVAPGVEHVRQDVGDFVVIELAHRRHDGVVSHAVHGDRTGEAVERDLDGALRRLLEQVGTGERREHVGDALALVLVTYGAGTPEQCLARLYLLLLRELAG